MPPVGPYSASLTNGDFVFTSGQIGIDENKQLANGFTSQVQQALANLGSVLDASGLGPANVIKSTIFLTDMGNYAEVNQLYCEFFGDHRPARSVVAVAGLPLGAEFEIEAIASTTSS